MPGFVGNPDFVIARVAEHKTKLLRVPYQPAVFLRPRKMTVIRTALRPKIKRLACRISMFAVARKRNISRRPRDTAPVVANITVHKHKELVRRRTISRNNEEFLSDLFLHSSVQLPPRISNMARGVLRDNLFLFALLPAPIPLTAESVFTRINGCKFFQHLPLVHRKESRQIGITQQHDTIPVPIPCAMVPLHGFIENLLLLLGKPKTCHSTRVYFDVAQYQSFDCAHHKWV